SARCFLRTELRLDEPRTIRLPADSTSPPSGGLTSTLHRILVRNHSESTSPRTNSGIRMGAVVRSELMLCAASDSCIEIENPTGRLLASPLQTLDSTTMIRLD